MKKLHSFAFYTLVTPAIALGSSALLAAETDSSKTDWENQTTQEREDMGKSDYSSDSSSPDSSLVTSDQSDMKSQSDMSGQDYVSATPPNGMRASHLIGEEVVTTGDEEVGSVSDLIIDQDGQVVAIVLGVGGFLGMGEKDVAISWDKVTKSGTSEDQKLRINETREALRDAPEYKEKY
jgi:sporulation protein YlmC with PRC-barrel domain